jgi:beta-galactosidase
MLGVCYYPEQWPEALWAADARRMAELGLTYVRIGEFAWSRIEPRRGDFRWDWLDRAIDTLGRAGLKVVLGTPTATPPKWLMDEHPEIAPVDEFGRPRGHGSRRHYSFASPVWREETRRIVEALARRYGRHDAIAGWQTDNEYGHHDTVLSWGAQDLAAFRNWLRRRYQTPEQLNEAWGNAFWSMDVESFDAVGLPHRAVTETNPAARLDFWRFSSEQVLAYDRLQTEIIRAHSPGRFVTHDFAGQRHDLDHWPFGDHLDFVSWNSYPVGFVERHPLSDAEKLRWAETGHPDLAAFHHDLHRGIGRGRFWVMEQQPGPVNWAPWNPIPKPGMIRLYTWEALAHGAEVVSYFRWRQAPFAQEQMHAGLNLPDDSGLTPGGTEARQVAQELRALGALPAGGQAPVALVFDYEASWITRIQPHGADFNYVELCLLWYSAARRLALDVDIVAPGAPLHGYKLILAPTLPCLSEAAVAAFREADGVLLYGPRTGSKTRQFAMPPNLPPGPLQDLLPMRVTEVASLRPGLCIAVGGAVAGQAVRWREKIEARADILARFSDGSPALCRAGRHHYLGCWPDPALLAAAMDFMVAAAGLAMQPLPESLRLRRRGGLTFAFNYGPEPADLPCPSGARFLLGAPRLAAAEVACWR